MLINTDTVIKVLQVVAWIIFIGLSIETGALLFNFIYALFNPVVTKNLYFGLNLSELFAQHKFIYACVASFLVLISALKAYVFYLVIRVFMTLNLVKPFSLEVATIIERISYSVFRVGLLGLLAHQFFRGLTRKGIPVDTTVDLYWDEWGTFLMMAAILLVITHIFKKGMDLQVENDLTV